MENKDLKWLKKHYGEKFSHLCRDLFPTLLEHEGLLSKLIAEHFLPSRELYEDLVNNDLRDNFKNYIYSLVSSIQKEKEKIDLSPEQLMDKAGYILYPECKTEEDIQKFRHYYHRGEPTPKYTGGTPAHYKGEELCTFNGRRLNSCRVWFAVRKDVDKIKRENFKNPRREDDYGTSVISIQFSKISPSTLSIKNRYNHTVSNPDATFSNNLDNIIEGLTQSFTDKYEIELANKNSSSFEIPNYVQARDGKFYRYNIEINNVYFCHNNTIIENGEVKILDKEKFLLFDHFILDLENKKIIDFNEQLNKYAPVDGFIESVGEIKDIKRILHEKGMTIQITPVVGEIVEINLNKRSEIVGYSNPNVENIGNYFLSYNKALTQINLPNVKNIEDEFLYCNKALTQINMPNVKNIGKNFLFCNNALTQLDLPSVKNIGNHFLYFNKTLTQLDLSNVENIEDDFLHYNNKLTQLDLSNVKNIGDDFLHYNNKLTQLDLPSVENIGNDFLYSNNALTQIDLPSVKNIGKSFLFCNNALTQLDLSNVENIGDGFLYYNNTLTQLDLPSVENIGNDFLYSNNALTQLNSPNVKNIGRNFLYSNKALTQIDLPSVKNIGNHFLYFNKTLTQLNLPNVKNIGRNFLYSNNALTQLDLSNVKNIGDDFLYYNNTLTQLNLPNVENIGDDFLYYNNTLTQLNLPNVENIGDYFLQNNETLKDLKNKLYKRLQERDK